MPNYILLSSYIFCPVQGDKIIFIWLHMWVHTLCEIIAKLL